MEDFLVITLFLFIVFCLFVDLNKRIFEEKKEIVEAIVVTRQKTVNNETDEYEYETAVKYQKKKIKIFNDYLTYMGTKEGEIINIYRIDCYNIFRKYVKSEFISGFEEV